MAVLFAPRFARGPRIRPTAGSTVPPAPAAPSTPSTPSPADAGTDYYGLLTWVATGAATCDIYLDTFSPPTTLVAPGFVGFSYQPAATSSTTYYWKIVARNAGGTATGPVWSFTTLASTAPVVAIAGAVATPPAAARVLAGSVQIRDLLNEAPNTASMVLQGTAPTSGETVQIGLGNLLPAHLIFAGEIQRDQDTYAGGRDLQRWPVDLIDYTFRLNRRRPFGSWVDVSASEIVREIVATFAPGFTAAHVQDNLPAVSITLDGDDECLTAIVKVMKQVGGFAYVDYAKDVHAFLEEHDTPPDALDGTHTSLLNDPPLSVETDLSQVRTRVYGKGAGVSIPCDLAVGETIVPVPDVAIFSTTGGALVHGTTADGAQSYVGTYAGVQVGGGGTVAGPGQAPSTAPTLSAAPGTGLGVGTFTYAYTWLTAAGHSLPSPTASVTTIAALAVNPPADTPTVRTSAYQPQIFPYTALLTVGSTYRYGYTFVNAYGESAMSAPSEGIVAGSVYGIDVLITYDGISQNNGHLETAVTGCNFYRSKDGGAYHKFASSAFASPVYDLYTTDADIAAAASPPAVGTATIPAYQRVIATNVAVGPTNTLTRNLFRGEANVSTLASLKVQQNIANNTATTAATDSTPDASLGAAIVLSDTSALTQAVGQINAGASSAMTGGAGGFASDGGWALYSGGSFRYSGVSANTLTGIPTTGAGSITTTIPYGTILTASPALVGVNANNGLRVAVALGAKLHLWVQRDDLAAQAALGALELDEYGNPTDGIHEVLAVKDERLSEETLTAWLDADLARYSRPVVTIRYTTRDMKTRSGARLAVNLPAPANISGSFTIQDVTIGFDGPSLAPRYQVVASSVIFTLTDLLRRVLRP